MTEQWHSTNGVHREHERRAAEVRARFAPGADPVLRADPRIEELDEQHPGGSMRVLTPAPRSLIIAAVTVFAAVTFFALRSRGRRGPSFFGRRTPSSAEKSLLMRGLEKGGLSLIALAVQRLGARGLDHLLGAEALPEPAVPELKHHTPEQAE
jgi:hypothetical protein